MHKEHPSFTPPPDNAVLWRYMDFTKFVSLLDRSALFLARADKLGDPFEGAFSRMNNRLSLTTYFGPISEENFQQLRRFQKDLRRFTLISCWHESPHESAAMWRLYSKETDGIAIKTDFESFKNSLTASEDIRVGRVNYVNYENHVIPENNAFYPFLHKRQSFEHEQEVRAINMTIPSNVSQATCDVGRYFTVDLSFLIKEVIVAPYADDWFLGLIQSVAARYDLQVSVVKSRLADPPTWD